MSKIAILEDNDRRIDEMMKCKLMGMNFFVFKRADQFINFISENKNELDCLSLDHDLEKSHPDENDPGDGRDVVRWICDNFIKTPIIIHTSNSVMGDSMFFNLKDNGNKLDRIDPYDDIIWINKSWINKIHSMVNNVSL